MNPIPAQKTDYKIMLVDDEPDILDLLEKALNIEGYYNIIKIEDGQTAVQLCRRTSDFIPTLRPVSLCCIWRLSRD